jgi:hypothetical protein
VDSFVGDALDVFSIPSCTLLVEITESFFERDLKCKVSFSTRSDAAVVSLIFYA